MKMNKNYSVIKATDLEKESIVKLQGYLQYKTGKYISQSVCATVACYFWLNFEKVIDSNFDFDLDTLIKIIKESDIQDKDMMVEYFEDINKKRKD